MGQELECKLAVGSYQQLHEILCDNRISALAVDPYREIRMRTTYFDTPDGLLKQKHWTLRTRSENGQNIVCLKTPTDVRYTCGEWQVAAAQLDETAIRQLVADGAPQALLAFYLQTDLRPICSAQFLRRCVMLRFADGSEAELAGDDGTLFGKTQSLDFTELELELYSGEAAQMLAFARWLCREFGLQERYESKFLRARELL